jgi:ribosomal peptide maturation radical SAM protein 1
MSTQIILINMPFAAIEHPSLALGLLQNYSLAYGNPVETVYANLEFAKIIGLSQFADIDGTFQESLIGEWIFSRSAFPDHKSDDNAYFALLTDTDEQTRKDLTAVREKADRFIDNLATTIVAKRPKIVGCTSTFQQNCASLALLRKIKALDNSIITLMGGANCEGIMGQTISRQFNWVDYVFSGECDEVIGRFFDNLLKEKSFDSHNLPAGVIAQSPNLLISNGKTPRAVVPDMSNVTTPLYDNYFETLERLDFVDRIKPGLLIETSRGCWWGEKRHCTFCGLNGHSMTHRAKAPDAVIEEMQHLSAKHNIDRFEVVDNILPMEYVKTVLPRLAANSNYAIFYETKANLRRSQVQALFDAGVKWIQPGFESLHDDFLKIIKKGTTAMQNIATLKACRAVGVRVSWNMLSCAPNENPDWYTEMAQWLPLIMHLQPPHHQLLNIRYPRFSPYFNTPDEFGLSFKAASAYQFVYPLSGQPLFDIAYFFEDKNEKGDNNQQPGHQLLQQKLQDWHQGFWHNSAPPLLIMTDHGSSLKVLDTRPTATQLAHDLTGQTAQIYRLCAEPVAKTRLRDKLAESGEILSEEQLEELLKPLLDNGLMIYLSHCYMALALCGVIPALPSVAENPAGMIYF